MEYKIYIIDDLGYELIVKLEQEMKKHKEKVKLKLCNSDCINQMIEHSPELILINGDSLGSQTMEFIQKITKEPNLITTPFILISSNPSKTFKYQVIKEGIQYYIRKPLNIEYLSYVIINLLKTLNITRNVNPLTNLPGNNEIQREIKKRLQSNKKFAVFYFDLDNFKSYNDVYGFSKGDEIIKFTAEMIKKEIVYKDKEALNRFVGHIGGDDFVAVTEVLEYEKICNEFIEEFDKKILEYFTKEDQEKGYLEVPNRRGIIEKFPLTSISVAVIEITKNKFKNLLEIGEVGAEVKKKAKQIQGSSYFIDRRNSVQKK